MDTKDTKALGQEGTKNCLSELVSESKNKKCVLGKSCLYCGTNYCQFVDEVKQLKKEITELKAENRGVKILSDEEFEQKYKISRWKLIFNRRYSDYD